MKKYLSTFTIIFSSFSATASMTGGVRVNFIDSFTRSCIQNQSAALINAGASQKMIGQYCKCNSTYIADLLNNQLVSEIEKGRVKFNSQWSDMATTYCRINYDKY